MLHRENEWVWDSWYVVEGPRLHAFYLMAPKSLGNPDLRHVNARVGHSVSADGRTWDHLDDVFGPGDENGFSGQAIWTGSIVRHEKDWHYFYTGIDRATAGKVQRIGKARSSDLTKWHRHSDEPLLSAQSPWYLTETASVDSIEPFRDPWVFAHQGIWHMLITASTPDGLGTIAHATSLDLIEWELGEPLAQDSGFRQIEVVQPIEVDGSWVLVFCAGPSDVLHHGVEAAFATYSAPAEGPLGPFSFDRAKPITPGGGVYAGRVVQFGGELALFEIGRAHV